MEQLYRISSDSVWNKIFNLMLDPKVSEIEANGPSSFFMKRAGKRTKIEGIQPLSEKDYYDGMERGLIPFVKSQNEFARDVFLFEGRLEFEIADIAVKARCHIVLPPSSDFPQITIAKKTTSLLSLEAIADAGSMSDEMRKFLATLVRAQVTVCFSGATGAGKALTLDTKIPTPYGWSTMGELSVGDKVYDRFGKIVNVTHKFMQPLKQVYEVTFNTGETIYCDIEHNWVVSNKNSSNKIFEQCTE